MSSKPKVPARLPALRPKASGIPTTPPVLRPKAGAIPATPFAKRRTFILTGAVALITVSGTLIGATLKSKEQLQEKQKIRERTHVNQADQIALLEATRSQLVAQKMHLEKKIGELRERQGRKAEADSERERLMAAAGTSVER